MKENLEETWKDIEGYEGVYQASTMGRIRSVNRLSTHGRMIKGRLLKQGYNRGGYTQVSLLGKTKSTHQIIAKTFIPNPENKVYVNHINHKRDDNRVENLEWCTMRENIVDAVNFGSFEHSKKSVIQVDPSTGNILNEYDSISDAVCMGEGKSGGNISLCCAGVYRHHAGWIWVHNREDIPNAMRRYHIKGHKGNTVIQVNKETGNIVNIFQSIAEASRFDKSFDSAAIHRCCIGKNMTHCGYIWVYHKDDIERVISKLRQLHPRSIGVVKIDKITGEILNQFPSMTLAAKSNPKFIKEGIWNCCRGRVKSHAGYVWRYKDA